MRRIDVPFTARPFFGVRRIARMLTEEGFPIDRKRVRRLMRLMSIAALGQKPRTSKPAPGHKVFPYLLRGLSIERPNQVWAADITYVPIGAGFFYLVAIMDWASRGAGVAPVEYDGHLLLPGGARRGLGALRQARDLQHRPGEPVH
jgi:putative transposase